ncbi:WecB/TagA/CpsF family glycosyltransferase [Teredinibacter turnerae]|uniref:WecB/TagA/CpsF family glycosyltransferase n=1 Tax=Teredinibacter turnerae TaxID=2426 RepID=UPI000490DBD3|nr:WecB/TagA/CpsF family glycosyltransferase [Teredinibacter turnerae]
MKNKDSLSFAGVLFSGLRKENLFSVGGDFYTIATVNADFIIRIHEGDTKLAKMLGCSICTFDGQVPFLLAKLVNNKTRTNPAMRKISGTELIYDIGKFCSERKKRLFLLGGDDVSNRQAVDLFKETYQIEVSGFSPPVSAYPFEEKLQNKIIHKIKEFGPDFLIVCLGTPKQEYWLHDNRVFLNGLGVQVGVGLGGAIDVFVGKFKRAPKVVQQLGLEGVYRLLQQPRLFRLVRLIRALKIFKYMHRVEIK